jgi:hypothetical protein
MLDCLSGLLKWEEYDVFVNTSLSLTLLFLCEMLRALFKSIDTFKGFSRTYAH